MSAHMSTHMSVHISTRMSAEMPTHMSADMSTHMSAHMSAPMSAHMSAPMSADVSTHMPASMPAGMLAHMSTHVDTCSHMFTDTSSHISTDMSAHMPTDCGHACSVLNVYTQATAMLQQMDASNGLPSEVPLVTEMEESLRLIEAEQQETQYRYFCATDICTVMQYTWAPQQKSLRSHCPARPSLANEKPLLRDRS